MALDTVTVRVLREHRTRQREMLDAFHAVDSGFVFQMSDGTPLRPDYLYTVFQRLIRACDLPPIRLHDLRHAFTVATMLDWYRDGGNVQARLPLLSTWLGHVDPKSTYWYLQAVPELLALAAGRLEQPDEEAAP